MTAPRTVAVVELGTTSIRMAVAEIEGNNRFTVLDNLQQSVSLGRDTLTHGRIESATVEDCVKALRRFSRTLAEYGVASPDGVRAIATSAVREAENRDVFLDRILIATGIPVAVVDQAEVSRLTYHAVRPILKREGSFGHADLLVVEVGGGSTEVLVFRRGRVESSHVHRMGSLRLANAMAAIDAPRPRRGALMRSEVSSTIEQIATAVPQPHALKLLALGSEARFACAWLNPGWDRHGLMRIQVDALAELTAEIIKRSPDELVRHFKVTYPEAETLGSALLIYVELARRLRLKRIFVGEVNLRTGMLAELAADETWTPEFKRQVLNSAMVVGRRYGVNEKHARAVMVYAASLFRVLREEHRLDTRQEMILTVAAWLHECGLFVSTSSHHKHSMYLILNSDIFGLGAQDLLLAALVARYHRRAMPNATHEPYNSLPREDRLTVGKLAAILRIANALDCNHTPHPYRRRMAVVDDHLLITLKTKADVGPMRLRIRERADLFEQIYGLRVELRTTQED